MHDLINKLQSKIFFLLSSVYFAAGTICSLIVYYYYDEDYFTGFFVIVFFFFLTGIIINFFVNWTIRNKANKLLSVYIVLRMVKFLLTVIFLAVFEFLILDDTYKLPFAITLLGNYILYTYFELYTFNLYYKNLVKK